MAPTRSAIAERTASGPSVGVGAFLRECTLCWSSTRPTSMFVPPTSTPATSNPRSAKVLTFWRTQTRTRETDTQNLIGLATAVGLGRASTGLPKRVEHVCSCLDGKPDRTCALGSNVALPCWEEPSMNNSVRNASHQHSLFCLWRSRTDAALRSVTPELRRRTLPPPPLAAGESQHQPNKGSVQVLAQ